jgi:hypothetical protein
MNWLQERHLDIKHMRGRMFRVSGPKLRRDNPLLVKCVETLGQAANRHRADLHIIEIPDNIDWEIVGEGGVEYVGQKHRKWGQDIDPPAGSKKSDRGKAPVRRIIGGIGNIK